MFEEKVKGFVEHLADVYSSEQTPGKVTGSPGFDHLSPNHRKYRNLPAEIPSEVRIMNYDRNLTSVPQNRDLFQTLSILNALHSYLSVSTDHHLLINSTELAYSSFRYGDYLERNSDKLTPCPVPSLGGDSCVVE